MDIPRHDGEMSVRQDCVEAINRLSHELGRGEIDHGPDPSDIVEAALELMYGGFARTMDTHKHEYPDKGKSVLLWWNGRWVQRQFFKQEGFGRFWVHMPADPTRPTQP